MEELEFGIKDVGAQLLPQVLHYYGEGQRGNQRLTDGNKAVLEHEESGRALRVFQGARGSVRYLGEFRLDEDEPYYETQAPATRGGPMRNALVFKLRPLDFLPDQAPTISGVGFSTPYRDADENASSAPAEPFRTDPNAVDRSNQAHARLQNLLANYAQTRGAEILSPGSLDPDFDVAWKLE